jgi:hypothetical protein
LPAGRVVDLVDHVAERALREVVERRHGELVAQQALRRHHDQRLAEAGRTICRRSM